jgi:uncharacterized membrane protein
MSPKLVIIVGHLAVALTLAGLGHPLAKRKVARNRLYGFRSPATLSDDTVWYEVNARAGRALRSLGLVLVPITLLTAWMPLMICFVVCNVALVVPLIFITVENWMFARRLLASRREGAPPGGSD